MRFMWMTLVGLLMVTPVGAQSQDAMRQISVEGTGRVAAVPDMAIVQLGVQREARDAGSALSAASEAMTSVLSQIADAGIDPQDVQTTGIGLRPVWNHSQDGSPPRVTSYVASNDLIVRVEDLDLLGDLLTAVVGEGANTMNGLNFDVTNKAELEDRARVAAVEDAARKATQLAEAAGVRLGAVASLSEGQQISQPGPMLEMAMSDRAAVPVAAGQIEITVTVRAVYSLEN